MSTEEVMKTLRSALDRSIRKQYINPIGLRDRAQQRPASQALVRRTIRDALDQHEETQGREFRFICSTRTERWVLLDGMPETAVWLLDHWTLTGLLDSASRFAEAMRPHAVALAEKERGPEPCPVCLVALGWRCERCRSGVAPIEHAASLIGEVAPPLRKTGGPPAGYIFKRETERVVVNKDQFEHYVYPNTRRDRTALQGPQHDQAWEWVQTLLRGR